MNKCENCFYCELFDWDLDTVTGKAIPVYWCEKGVIDCSDCSDCSYYAPLEDEVDNEDSN